MSNSTLGGVNRTGDPARGNGNTNGTHLSRDGPLGLDEPAVDAVGTRPHGRVHLLDARERDESKPSGTLRMGYFHDLRETIGKLWKSRFHLGDINSHTRYNSFNHHMKTSVQLFTPDMSSAYSGQLQRTTQSVRVPHFSKYSFKLSLVVSKFKPPMKSFRNRSGSRSG